MCAAMIDYKEPLAMKSNKSLASLARSSCKENRNIIANKQQTTVNTPSKTSYKKVKHSEFRLFE